MTDEDTTLSPVVDKMHISVTVLFRRAPVDDVMAWGESLDHLLECKSELTYGFTPLTLVKSSSPSSFHPRKFPAARPRTSSLAALRLLQEHRGYILPLTSSNPFGDRFKVDDTGRDKAPNRSCRLGDSSLLLFIYKAGTGRWLFIWPYSRPLFENDLKGQTGYFSLSFLSLLCWNEYSLSVIFQPVVSCAKINCPPEDKSLHPTQLLHFPLKKCSNWQIDKQ